jgi:hypothetical protein
MIKTSSIMSRRYTAVSKTGEAVSLDVEVQLTVGLRDERLIVFFLGYRFNANLTEYLEK